MKRAGLMILLACWMLVGCSRDPVARRQEYMDSGTRFFKEAKYQEAAIQFQNALQADPRYAEGHYQLAQCYLKLQIWQGSFTELRRTIDLQPNNSKARVELADLLIAGKEYKWAQEQIEAVLKQEPDNVDALIQLAKVHSSLNETDQAFATMDRVQKLAPNRPDTHLVLAQIQAAAQQPAAAEKSFKKAQELDPKSVATLIPLATFFQQQARWADAEQTLRQAIAAEPRNRTVRVQLARLFLAQNQKAQAEQVVIEAKKTLGDDPEGYRMLGDFYFNNGEMDKAFAEYETLFRQHPDDARVKKNHIQLLLLRNRVEEAAKLNDEILKANSKDTEGLIYQGQILNKRGKPADAIRSLEAALKNEPENPEARFHLGIALKMTGNTGQAQKEWREALRLRPQMTGAYRALAEVALQSGDADSMKEIADTMIQSGPWSADGYFLRGTAFLLNKNYPQAESDLKKAIDIAPQNPVGYTRLAALRVAQNRASEAEGLYEQALKLDGNSLEALQGLVGIYQKQNQSEKALARVRSQVAASPTNSQFYYLLGALEASAKNIGNAQAALEKAVALDKNNLDAFLLLGQVHAVAGSVDKAVAMGGKFIQEHPQDVRGYMLVGFFEESRGNWQRAEEMYQKALQASPEHPMASNNLAYLMLDHGGNVDVALSYAQTARSKMPDAANVADTLAWAYYQKGTYGLATDLLEEALRKSPQNPIFHYHLGMVYQKLNKASRAREHLEKALQINPKFPNADDARRALDEL
jgi:tetratricopeptide (TPR) repeat protein